MANQGLAPHETIELRELLTNEIASLKKIKADLSLVNDRDLKSYMQKCMDSKMGKVESIQQFIDTQQQFKQ